MIRFSCSDYTFPLLSTDQRFALLKLLGFTHVDIGLFERSADLTPSRLLTAPRAFIRQLQQNLAHASLEVSDIFLQTGVDPSESATNDPNPEARARNRKLFLHALELCSALGCRHLTGLPGVWHNEVEQTSDMALAVDEAGWRESVASDAGIAYAVEAHVGSICPNVANARSLLAAVPGLTLTLDYGHFVAEGVPSRDIHPLLRFASHIHARCGAPDRLQTPLSENQIDFGGMVGRLARQKYSGFVAIEYVYLDWQQCNRTDNISETILLRRLLEACQRSRVKKTQPLRGTRNA
jgi:sugar phosphate isomerase/epimerase